jgi:hypothetical protein
MASVPNENRVSGSTQAHHKNRDSQSGFRSVRCARIRLAVRAPDNQGQARRNRRSARPDSCCASNPQPIPLPPADVVQAERVGRKGSDPRRLQGRLRAAASVAIDQTANLHQSRFEMLQPSHPHSGEWPACRQANSVDGSLHLVRGQFRLRANPQASRDRRTWDRA